MRANLNVEIVVGPLLQGRVLRVLSTRDPILNKLETQPTVEEVKKLETVACAKKVLDRDLAGCNLAGYSLQLCSGARFADLASMQSFFYDVIDTGDGPCGFVEGRTRIHKTSSSAEKKAYLPFVAPIEGVDQAAGLWLGRLSSISFMDVSEPFGSTCRAPTSWRIHQQAVERRRGILHDQWLLGSQ